MQMNDDEFDMALNNYGYGSWKAPYWFLGPEQGMDSNENGNLDARIATWRSLGSLNLDDCRKFHLKLYPVIHPRKTWHGDGASLQPTWDKLILTLLAFLKRRVAQV